MTHVAVVGGGAAGLSAAYKFKKANFNDFLLLELEDKIGGTAQSGTSEIVPYPWGAHYLPVPFQENTELVALLDEVGFAPEREAEQQPAGGTARINLRNCPFLELAQDRPQITCPIHLGLMRGAMEAWGSARGNGETP